MKKITLLLLFLIGCDNNSILNKNGLKTQNVILITLDGVRWQEVFQGADKRKIVLDTFIFGDLHWNKNGTKIVFNSLINKINF